MTQNIYPSLLIEDRVLGVNLENNSLESLQADQLPPNLMELYLANNKLRGLPDSILDNQENLKNLSLSGNPWNCDCSALKFKKWLTSKYSIVRTFYIHIFNMSRVVRIIIMYNCSSLFYKNRNHNSVWQRIFHFFF